MDLLVDLLLPRTDVGSLTQAIVIGVSLALWRLWSRSDLTLLIIGLGVFLFGLIGQSPSLTNSMPIPFG